MLRTLTLLHVQMRPFSVREEARELCFEDLLKEWLQDQLPPEVVMAHQTIGTSIVDIHLKVAVGRCAFIPSSAMC